MLRKFIYLFILAAALSPQSILAQTSVSTPEEYFPDLKTILINLPATSPDLRAEGSNVEEREANLDSAKSYGGPKVTGFARLQAQYETRINSEVSYEENLTIGPYANITASVPIFHWGEIKARIDTEKSRVESAKERTLQRAAEIRQDIRRSYIEYQLALKAADIARDDIANAEKERAGMLELADKGMLPKEDLAEIDIYIQSRREDLAYAQSQSEYFLGELGKSSGVRSLEIAEAPLPQIRIPTEEQLLDLRNAAACANLPSIEALEAELAAEKASCREISSRNKPKIDALISGNLDYIDEYRSESTYENVPRTYAWGGIQASWTMYDSGTNDADKRSSLARQRRINTRIEQAKQAQIHDVDNIVNDARLNASRAETRRKRAELMKMSVEMIESHVTAHDVSANELFQRKLDLRRTEMDLLRAEFSCMLDVAQLREIVGFCKNK